VYQGTCPTYPSISASPTHTLHPDVRGVVSVGRCGGELAGAAGAYLSPFLLLPPFHLVLFSGPSSSLLPQSIPSRSPPSRTLPHAAIYPRTDNRWHLLPCLREAHVCRCVAVCVRVESPRAALCSQTADARGPSLRTHGLVKCLSSAPCMPYLLPPAVSPPIPAPAPPLLLPTHIAPHLLSFVGTRPMSVRTYILNKHVFPSEFPVWFWVSKGWASIEIE
jgi:hypothetical protein